MFQLKTNFILFLNEHKIFAKKIIYLGNSVSVKIWIRPLHHVIHAEELFFRLQVGDTVLVPQVVDIWSHVQKLPSFPKSWQKIEQFLEKKWRKGNPISLKKIVKMKIFLNHKNTF